MTVRNSVCMAVRVAIRSRMTINGASYGGIRAADEARLFGRDRLDLDMPVRKLKQKITPPVEDGLANDHVVRIDVKARPAALEACLERMVDLAEVDRVRELLAKALESLLVSAMTERAFASGVVELGDDFRGKDVDLQALTIGNKLDGGRPSGVHLSAEIRKSAFWTKQAQKNELAREGKKRKEREMVIVMMVRLGKDDDLS